ANHAGTQTFFLFARGPNVAPTVNTPPVTTATAGATYRYRVDASVPFDRFTFQLLTGPAGMTVDAQTGIVLWQPTSADLAAHPAPIRLTTERGAVTDLSYSLTVTPDTQPPSVSVLLSTNLTQIGQSVTIQVKASDNVAVASLTLTVGGTPLTLDANG